MRGDMSVGYGSRSMPNCLLISCLLIRRYTEIGQNKRMVQQAGEVALETRRETGNVAHQLQRWFFSIVLKAAGGPSRSRR